MANEKHFGTVTPAQTSATSLAAAAPKFPTAAERAAQLDAMPVIEGDAGNYVGVPEGYKASAIPSGSAVGAARLRRKGYIPCPDAKCIGSEEMEVWVLPAVNYDKQVAKEEAKLSQFGLAITKRNVNLADLFQNLGAEDPRITNAA